MQQSDLESALGAYILDDGLRKHISAAVTHAFGPDSACPTSKGLLMQSFTGGGKTSILQEIFKLSGKDIGYMLDCSSLRLSHRGRIESEILNLGTKGKRLLLVDNVDALPSSGKKGSAETLTLSSTSFTSALLHVIDTGNVFVVATCTNAQDVDVGLLQPYRLGSPLALKLPTKTHREQIILTILSDPTLALANDTQYQGVNAVSKELALRTQGLSACDLWKIMREQYQRAAQNNANAGANESSVILSTQQLFQAVSLAATSAQANAQEDDASKFVRPVDYDAPAPVLFGMEAVQLQLLQCIGTIVPELAKEIAASSSHRTRKCSGVVLCGPSGSGKTALTDWLAHAVRRHCQFISVPCADLVHKVVGETEKRLAEIFATARELSPCIVLLDNLDMLLGASSTEADTDTSSEVKTSAHPPGSTAGSGSGGGGGRSRGVRSTRTRHQAVDRMLSTLLVEVDGVYTTSSSAGTAAQGGLMTSPSVLVVATTTSMSCLDRALVRPGRLEEHISLSLPGREQREAYLLGLLRGLQGGDEGELESRLEACAKQCAANTPGRSYAHLRALYQEANIAFARETLFASMASTGSAVDAGSATTAAATSGTDRVTFVLNFILSSCMH